MAVRPLILTAPDGVRLAAMAHPGDAAVGVLVVPGAPQTRAGAHRGFVALATALSARGHPVLRFDRRGLGDSDGEDPGFRAIGPDIAAAGAALRAAFPTVRRVIGLGLCDGAAALALDPRGFDALALLNPWLADGDRMGDLPPVAAIRARYRDRLLQPRHWLRLLRGGVRLGALARGVQRAAQGDGVTQTAVRIAGRLADFPGPTLIALAGADATAQAFAQQWRGPMFEQARRRAAVELVTVAGAGHTFARPEHAAALAGSVTAFAARC
jgi:exosortase A-associated hydrolase 1